MIEISKSDGQALSAYRADPSDEPKGAVVFLQEIFGVTPAIRALTDEFADKGYIAIAPSLFDRVKKSVELGFDEAGIKDGLELANEVGLDNAISDIQATVDTVKDCGKVALVGYDWGGYLAYHAANRVSGIACATAYYACGLHAEFHGKRKVPTLLHFGTTDQYIPFELVQMLRYARPDLSIYDYPAGHGFNCPQRDTFNPEATEKAMDTTMTMITHIIEGPPKVTLKNQGAYAAPPSDKKKKKKKAGADDMGPPP